ncbi:MAG TPA: YegP family protein [Solirubrobacterales bacterium]
MNRFEAFTDMEDKWRWRLIGTAGRVLVSSNEPFPSQVEALRAAELVKVEGIDAPVTDTVGIGPKEVIARLIRREEARRLKVGTDEKRRPAPRRSGRARRTRRAGTRPALRAVGARRPA